MLIASAWGQARLVWNFTSSIPIGLYSFEDRPWSGGDRVALKPSGRLLETLREAGVLYKRGHIQPDKRLVAKRSSWPLTTLIPLL